MIDADGKPRFFFDISSLVEYISKIDRYSGIQRVVVNIISEMDKYADEAELYVCFFAGVAGSYVAANLIDIGVENFDSPEKLRNALNISSSSALSPDVLKKYRDSAFKYLFHRTKLDMYAFFGIESKLKKYNLSAENWKQIRFPKNTKSKGKLVRHNLDSFFKAGDNLFVLDSSWLDRHRKIFVKAKESGVVIHTLVYDLIPILLPQTTAGLMPLMFYNWLLNSTTYTSTYLSISEATKKDLLEFFKTHECDFEVVTIPLVQQGVEKLNDRAVGPLRNEIRAGSYPWLIEVSEISDTIRNIATVPYVLCVGTIEARKNVWRIAQAWQLLRQRTGLEMPRLVFAGRRGWLIDNFDLFLKSSGSLAGWIDVVEGPSDEELAFLYRNCKFVIMASIYEGWGLPVGEALAYGKTAVVSNCSSLPEVGGNLVEYCDPNSIGSIADACERLISNPHRLAELETKIANTQLRNWADVARDLYDATIPNALRTDHKA